MTSFLQLHVITSYPPANLNRDDLGRPKTAIVGGSSRLRISSQSLKRAWRQSSVFGDALAEHRGWRTREMAKQWVYEPLLAAGVAEGLATDTAQRVAAVFGKQDAEEPMLIRQLAHIGPVEKTAIDGLVERVIAEQEKLPDAAFDLLRAQPRAVDIALFGRMLADEPNFNLEAAAQVAHAISVHPVTIEDDYFTAVDDLNRDDRGAGHVGEAQFAAGVFYLYLCVDCDRLAANLDGDQDLAGKTLRALTETACTVGPSGKQNSFASRAVASFVLAEQGERQPRSLSVAFLDGIDSGSYIEDATVALERQVEAFDTAYGPLASDRYTLDVARQRGTLSELLDFVAVRNGASV